MKKTNSRLRVPALRATMGDWWYYASVLRMVDIAARVKKASDIHSSELLRELLQRRLTDRSKGISTYLRTQQQRFFNSIVVGVYGGSPQWEELDIRSRLADEEVLPEYYEGVFGILSLDDNVQMWAIDGQHRVTGIESAVGADHSLSDEQVSVIFVSGVNSSQRAEDEAGFQRTRRLFTTLNKHPVKVAKKDIIALDEDDVSAIVTRQILDEYQGLSKKVALEDSLPKSNKTSFTAIEALYDSVDTLLARGKRNWKRIKLFRPSDAEIEQYYEEAEAFLNILGEEFSAIGEAFRTDTPQTVIPKYRNEDGGHMAFRPVGFRIIAKTIRQLMDVQGFTLKKAAQSVASRQLDIGKFPWRNLLWNPVNQTMIPKNQALAQRILFYISGGSLKEVMKKESNPLLAVQKDYAGKVNMEISEVDFGPLIK